MSEENSLRPFALGELWAGSGGMKCDKGRCKKRTFMLYLTPREVRELSTALPDDIFPGDDMPTGPRAASMMFQRNFGKALCDKHAPTSAAP